MLPNPQAWKWMKAKVEDQVDVHSYNVHTKDGRVFAETEDTLGNPNNHQ